MSDDRARSIGRSVPRVEDNILLRGSARFIDDIKIDRLLHVAMLRSPLASAVITEVDVSAAAVAPGVVGVFTASDLLGSCDELAVPAPTPGVTAPSRPVIAGDRARFVGEIVAAVVADSRYHAEDALDQMVVDLEPLQAVTTFEDARAGGAPLVHETVPENRYFLGHRTMGDVERAFNEAGFVIEGEVTHPRVTAAPIEGRGAVAMPEPDGGVTVFSSTQAPHLVAEAIAETLHLDLHSVRVVAADVGGGFGLKVGVYTEELLLAWIARRLGAPVKWIEDRSEHMQSANHARDQRIRFSAAVRADGRVLGLRATVLSSTGAYPGAPYGGLLAPMTCPSLMPGPYDIRNYEYDSHSIATNTCPEGPYRGVGMVTAVLAHERLMDLIASRLGADPAEVRRRNLIQPQQMPYLSVTGHPFESGDYPAALESALAAVDYERLRSEQRQARSEGRLVGIGIGTYVEFTGAGSSTFKGR